jgi:hypothetical protein
MVRGNLFTSSSKPFKLHLQNVAKLYKISQNVVKLYTANRNTLRWFIIICVFFREARRFLGKLLFFSFAAERKSSHQDIQQGKLRS